MTVCSRCVGRHAKPGPTKRGTPATRGDPSKDHLVRRFRAGILSHTPASWTCPRTACCSCPACCTPSACAGAPARQPGGQHLQAGGAGAALAVRRHPDEPARPGQRHRCLDRRRLPRRGHRGARRGRAVPARGVAGRQGRRPHARDRGRRADLHRPDRHPGPDPRGRPVVDGTRRHHGGNIQVVPPPTAGRCGPRRCARAASTTPPPLAPTPSCSPRSPPGSTTASSGWPTWATKAKPNPQIPIKKTAGTDLTCDQQAYNAVHGALRALGEGDQSPPGSLVRALLSTREATRFARWEQPPQRLQGVHRVSWLAGRLPQWRGARSRRRPAERLRKARRRTGR